MKTLVTYFSEGRNQLEAEIDKAKNLEQVVKLLQTRIDEWERVYINNLNVAQVRLSSLFLETLKQSIATLAAANLTQVNLPQQQVSNQHSSNLSILKLSQVLISLGLFASLFSITKDNPSAWMDILLASSIIGIEVAIYKDKNSQPSNSSNELLKLPQASLKVDSKILLDNLADAFNTIDLAVARVEAAGKNIDDLSIEELPELLNFLQRLIGASNLNKPQIAIELAKLLPQILREQGILAQIYQANDPQSRMEYFDFEPSIDPDSTEYINMTPALLKGDRLLRRGRVIEPSKKNSN